MKVTYSWLKEFVDIKLKPQELADKLTMVGLSVATLDRVTNDWVYDIEVSSNRPDWLSVRGIAHEVAAVTGGKLKEPAHGSGLRVQGQAKKKNPSPVKIHIDDKKDCCVYYGYFIKGVTVRPSPPWLKKRLEDVGIRSVNNAVDITNYCMMELGQPLHAFDYDNIKQAAIVVRRAREGEKIVLIDETEKKLTSHILVIADGVKPIAVAGIMGGRDTEVSLSTKNIFLEAACFSPVLIRRGSRLLGVASDSSYRFERGVDPSTIKTAIERATAMIRDLCGGALVSLKHAGAAKGFQEKQISFNIRELQHILSIDISPKQTKAILERLGFGVKSKASGAFKVSVPSYRRDIKTFEDITEEIARIYGYDQIPLTAPAIKPCQVPASVPGILEQRLKTLLVGMGLKEVVTYSLISEDDYKKTSIDIPDDALSLENPLSQDYRILRTTLLSSFLGCVSFNINRNQKDFEIFEIAHVFGNGTESMTLGIALVGAKRSSWQKEARAYAFFDAKGIIETIFEELRINHHALKQTELGFAERGTGCQIVIGDRTIGQLGKISEAVKKAWGIKGKEDIFFAEVSVQTLSEHANLKRTFRPFSSTPSILRDISVLAHQEALYSRIKALIEREAQGVLKNISLMECYQGKEIPKGQIGLTVSVEYGSDQRTFTESEINPIHQKILASLTKELSLTLR